MMNDKIPFFRYVYFVYLCVSFQVVLSLYNCLYYLKIIRMKMPRVTMSGYAKLYYVANL